MSPWRAWLLCTALLGGAGLVRAQADGLSEQLERLRLARQELSVQLRSVETTSRAQQSACWQRFAVNDCLIRERRALRQAQAPLKARDLDLADQERALREQQRLQRLSARESEAGREP